MQRILFSTEFKRYTIKEMVPSGFKPHTDLLFPYFLGLFFLGAIFVLIIMTYYERRAFKERYLKIIFGLLSRNDELFAPKLFAEQNDFMKIPCVLPDSGDVVHHPFRGEAAHFLDAILDDARPFPDLEDAAKTHEVCFAADISAQEGRCVALSEFES